jgi:hypothetical protein
LSEGADIQPPLSNGVANVARVFAGARSRISALLVPRGEGWVHGASVVLEVLAPDSGVLAFSASASGLSKPMPFELTMTYEGARKI